MSQNERIIARFHGKSAGPAVAVVAAIHGNEPRTVEAAKRVAARLHALTEHICGEVVMVVGNQRALREDIRQVHSDLNRLWSPERTAMLESGMPLSGTLHEDHEQSELFAVLDPIFRQASERPVFLVDLHSTSSDGAPFVVCADSTNSPEIACQLPIPWIAGLERDIENLLITYGSARGARAVVFEGGWHYSPTTADCLEALLWLSLTHFGTISRTAISDLDRQAENLAAVCREIGRVQEVIYHHRISPEDHFQMRPGFRNFQEVKQGQFLAVDKNGPIHAISDGRVFMPLYQSTGSQGFLLTRDKS